MKTEYKGIELIGYPFKLATGTNVTLMPCMENVQDVTINNDSLTILTSEKQVTDIFIEKKVEIDNVKKLLKNTALKIYTYIPEVTSSSMYNSEL